MAAELYLSLQRTPEAVKLLSELFERQVDAGDNTRASLTYKKLTRYSNPSSAQKVRFGQILETSNRKLALETYESSLEDLAKQGRRQEVLAVLKRMVALEPLEKNLRRLAEQAAELEDHKTAAGSFLKMAEMTAASGGDPSSWYERAYGEDPNDPAIVLGYSKALLSQGQVGAVIFVLEALVRAGNAGADIRGHGGQAPAGAHGRRDRCVSCARGPERRAMAGAGPSGAERARQLARPGLHARGADRAPGRALAPRPGAVRRQPVGLAEHGRG